MLALLDAGSSVTLLSEKLQCQFILCAMSLDSHYGIVGTTGDCSTTLGTAQVNIGPQNVTFSSFCCVITGTTHSS